LAGHADDTVVDALVAVLPSLRGAFSLVLIDHDRLVAARAPHGVRAPCLGRLGGGWVLASETPALDVVGAHFVREVEPGEVLTIDAGGEHSHHPFPTEALDPKLCIFEFVYLARPDS